MKIAFLTCPGTMPGSPRRRADAHEHDLQVAAIRPAIEARGGELFEIDWRAPLAEFSGADMVLIGTPWDYQDDEAAFLARLDRIENIGIAVANPAATVRWNARKTYLRELAERGAPTIATIWADRVRPADVERAFESFGCDAIVAKRQVGAGAEGQSLLRMGQIAQGWQMDEPAMLQPYLPRIAREGEYSFIFIDGQFSHALIKRPAPGDYRVQSIYGGREEALEPVGPDLAAARAIVGALPCPVPLYARIDMVRDESGALLLMEAELIEPYLYPEQGPELGPRLAEAIARRIAKR